jgi:dual specificity protein kinase YAK1
MDPTFGGQELLESLSQASSAAKSRQSKDSRASKGGSSKGGGSSNSTLTSTHTNPVEDAYRRIGQGLSQRAHSDDRRLGAPRQRAQLGTHPCTSFQRYQRPSKKPFNPHDAVAGHPHPPQGGPSPKIAKLGRFQDQHHLSGEQPKNSQRLLKNITMHAKETFHKWRRQQKAGYLNKYSSATLSTSASSGTTSTTAASLTTGSASLDKYGRLMPPEQHQQQLPSLQSSYDSDSSQRHAFSHLALQQHEQQVLLNQQHKQGNLMNHVSFTGAHGPGAAPKGLLSAVLEGGSESTYESESVHSLPTISSQTAAMSKSSSVRTGASGTNASYHQYPGPSSGSGMLQATLHTQNASAAPALHYATTRGPCLTQPAEPVANDGLDNVEGNLILFQNDILVVPGRKGQGRSNKGLEFHIQSLLGQGTFAQVFCCWESVSKSHVALKIIKNKPAFTKQAAVEIEVFQALAAKRSTKDPAASVGGSTPTSPHMVNLLSSFMYKSHLCLVFELLGLNLYEVLKRRQFCGLPLPMVRSLIKQALEGVKELAGKTIVHCDLKPENILLVGEEVEKDVIGAGEGKKIASQQPRQEKEGASGSSVASASSMGSVSPQRIKLIDFGSACFEGYSAHTYIQSRFYRSPEVLMGLPYDSAIDMWSLGCVAAELFLGLPILPGVHEHDQCGRISEMIGEIPDWMLEQGQKSTKYYVKYVPRTTNSNLQANPNDPMHKASPSHSTAPDRPMLPQWRLKTQEEYIKSLTQNEIRKKGGLAKLEKQPANRYFKRTKLSDIIMLHGQHCIGGEKELLGTFVHFLYGMYFMLLFRTSFPLVLLLITGETRSHFLPAPWVCYDLPWFLQVY